jgi:uridine phosphorylase
MKYTIPESELVLNADGSVYHLNLLPEDVADTIILVGDQDRVPEVSKHFDKIEIKKQKREFVTHTGFLKNKRISVISTGIGTDNIDIVLNELDALVHVDLATRQTIENPRKLKIVRIGTSGAIQASNPIDSILVSEAAIGLDNLLWYYQIPANWEVPQMAEALKLPFIKPYHVQASKELNDAMPQTWMRGTTVTCSGFYAPQGRQLRKQIHNPNFIQDLSSFQIPQSQITNFEMETAGILGLSALFGFEAISINVILANRITHQFSQNPQLKMKEAIETVLMKLTE